MRFLYFISFVVFLLSCRQSSTEGRQNKSMSGVYELRAVSYKGEGMDTSFPAQNQVKIYTDNFYMYGTTRPDSSAFFGFGTYMFNDSSMVEQSIYNSFALDSVSETNLKIIKTDSGYRQVQSGVMMQGNAYDVGESYKLIPEAEPSTLDGVWEQVSFINITGSDTTAIRNKQYKIYKGGHFMWVHHYAPDPLQQKFSKGYGYGKFTVKDNKVTESIIASNYAELIEAPITINYTLNGKNELLLIFNNGNSTTTETYRRLN